MSEYNYEIINGIKCYNPEVALGNEYYPVEAYETLFRLEKSNFWFKARNRLIIFLFKKFSSKSKELKTLEIGCGTGFVLSWLKKLPNLKLSGAEVLLEGLKFASSRLPEVEFIQADAVNLQFKDDFDIICTFDVLEHIEEDEKAIKNIFSALRNNGLYFISVPQHKFIWGEIDVISNHKRRYSRKELILKLKSSGFKILYVSSFVFFLFPFMIVSRFINKKSLPKGKDDSQDLFHELKIPGVVNSIFYLFMLFDEMLIRIGLKLPYGGSLIAVAQKIK